jgi:acetamidase/formamidase
MARTHYFPADRVQYKWDNRAEPVLSVAPGDTVVFELRDVSDNQIGPASTSEVLARLDWDRVYPLSGPIHVEGAAPGDALEVEVLDLHTRGWGWAAIIPGLGLLAEEIPGPYLKVFDLTSADFTHLTPNVRIPIQPFLGTMGVAPAEAGQFAIMPPGVFGGNMDTRQLVRGSRLRLPVQVPGALFACGDAHAAQGDGEVCVTGIESPMYAALRFGLTKGARLPAPQFWTPAAPSTGPCYATTGVGPDLFAAARDAVRAMVAHLQAARGLAREDAYVLCSLAGDLKISEIVDQPNWIVSMHMPDAVFV